MWEAIKSRLCGNDESKKLQKYILKQHFKSFSVSNSEGLHKGYDMFQSLLSQLKIHGAGVSTKDANKKFVRSLPASWSQVSLIMRTKPGVDTLSFDDLYNNLRVFESDVKGSTASSSSTQNVAFFSFESTSSTNEASTAYGVSTSSVHNSQREGSSSYTDELMYSFFANQSKKDNGRRPGKQEEPKSLVTLSGDGVDWTGHSKDEQENFALMAYSNSGSDTEDKSRLGYGNQIHKGILSYENEVFRSVLDSRSSDIEDSLVNDRYAEGMHAVPPPMTGIYMPPRSDFRIDESMFTYETLESVPKPIANKPKAVSKPKVWSDAPIIEEYESDSDDEHKALKNKGIVNSGRSNHMTGNKAYLVDYQDYNGGPIAFGGSKGHITDTECLVLSLDFKLPGENKVLLRVPRQNNMYSFNLENIIPTGGLACLIAKAIVDESNK
nr:hypothetical protein [Tanacetum cinerariifolium]